MSIASEDNNMNSDIPSNGSWHQKISTSVKGYIGFESASFGAALAFPVALLNAATTIQGAAKVLPAGLGSLSLPKEKI